MLVILLVVIKVEVGRSRDRDGLKRRGVGWTRLLDCRKEVIEVFHGSYV